MNSSQFRIESKHNLPFIGNKIKESPSATSIMEKNHGRGDFVKQTSNRKYSSLHKLDSISSCSNVSSKTSTKIHSTNPELQLDLSKKSSGLSSNILSNTSICYSDSIRTQSAPALLHIKDFKQIKSIATQTSLLQMAKKKNKIP